MNASPFVEQLREGSEEVARDRFAIAGGKAREKLQKFQLADPHRYVLQFIQAAHLLGASWIEIAIDADEVELHFDGEPIEESALEGIDAAAFQRGRDDRSRAMRHLAIGILAARDVDPARIVVASGGEQRMGVRWIEEAGGESRVESGAGPDRGTTHIYLRETLRASHLSEFFHKFGNDLAEQRLVRKQCPFSSIPIRLDGERVSRGLHLPVATVSRTVFESEVGEGVLGFRDPRGVSWRDHLPVGKAWIVQNGVTVATHPFRGPASLRAVEPYAVLESDELTKDLSENEFVRDEAWHELAHRVLPEVLAEAVAGYVGRMKADDIRRHRAWLARIGIDLWDSEIDRTSGGHGQLADQMRRLPIWPTACRPPEGIDLLEYKGTPMASLDVLRGDRGRLLYSRASIPPLVDAGFERPVLDVSGIGGELPEGLADGARDVTESLLQAAHNQTNNEMWRARRKTLDRPEQIGPTEGFEPDAVLEETESGDDESIPESSESAGDTVDRGRTTPETSTGDEGHDGEGSERDVSAVDACGGGHPLADVISHNRIVFEEIDAEVVELLPEGLRFDREHPAAAYLLGRGEPDGGASVTDADPVRIAFVVSSLYTALSRKLGTASGRDDFDFYARHLNLVGSEAT
ncbi:MAG: hypothetical protein ABEN55_14360 [Bradymonadaceae bacterium]